MTVDRAGLSRPLYFPILYVHAAVFHLAHTATDTDGDQHLQPSWGSLTALRDPSRKKARGVGVDHFTSHTHRAGRRLTAHTRLWKMLLRVMTTGSILVHDRSHACASVFLPCLGFPTPLSSGTRGVYCCRDTPPGGGALGLWEYLPQALWFQVGSPRRRLGRVYV